jgi:hypothetical protein
MAGLISRIALVCTNGNHVPQEGELHEGTQEILHRVDQTKLDLILRHEDDGGDKLQLVVHWLVQPEECMQSTTDSEMA